MSAWLVWAEVMKSG